MKRIPILKNFDRTKPVGYMLLTDDAFAELLPEHEFTMAYTVLAGTPEHPTKIHLHELGLIYTPKPDGRK